MGLSSSDFVQIYERGISLENIKTVGIFKNGCLKDGFG
jgi:hypothetical protein